MSTSTPPDLGTGVAEPFQSDPEFWRSVCASADAFVLLGIAVATSALQRFAGAAPGLPWLPFALPAIFLVQAALSGYRFHRCHAPLPALVDTIRGELPWRDAERTAVAAAFGRALVRSRHLISPAPSHPMP
ncbi:MAG: hypothetical protein ABJA93_08345 [Sporichthyaceae bacterium]